MSAIPGLLAAFERGEAIRPRFDAPQIVALARAVRRVAGATGEPPDPVVDRLVERLGGRDHLVVFLADGCGMNFVRDLDPAGPIRSHLVAQMQAAFPTSTGPNLFAFTGACWPAEHGFLGWDVYLPSAGRVITPYRWRTADDGTPLETLGVAGPDVFRARPFGAGCARSVRLIQPSAYAGTPATHAAATARAYRGVDSLEEGVRAVREHVRGGGGPTLSYLYWPEPDGAAHRLGTGHPETRAAVDAVERALGQLIDTLGSEARIVFLADHGHLDAPPAVRIRIDPDEPLARCLDGPPAGESRIGHLRLRAGQERAFRAAFDDRLAPAFHLLTTDEVDALRLLGPDPLDAACRARIGDVTLISKGAHVFGVAPAGAPSRLALASTHGGLTPDETLVPLVIV